MIKSDNSAERFGHAREQTSQVGAAGNRMRERDNSLVNVGGGGPQSANHNQFLLRHHRWQRRGQSLVVWLPNSYALPADLAGRVPNWLSAGAKVTC